MQYVVQDFTLEALFDDASRSLAGAEARDARAAGVGLGDPGDVCLDYIARNLDAQFGWCVRRIASAWKEIRRAFG